MIDTATFTETLWTPSVGGESAGVMATMGSLLLYPTRTGSPTAGGVVADLSTATETALTFTGSSTPSEGMGMLVEPSGQTYWLINKDESYPMDAATHTQLDFDGDGAGDTFPSDEQIRAHFMAMTPF